MSSSYGTFPINLSSGLMSRFGRIELFRDKFTLSGLPPKDSQKNSGSTTEVKLNSISSIRLKTWLYFNSKIVIEYLENEQKKTIDFAFGGTWSTNMFKTIYLYATLKDLKDKGVCDTSSLSKRSLEDKLPVVLMFAGCSIGLVLITALLGSYSKGALVHMLAGSALFGIPVLWYLYIFKAKKLIRSIEE
jgi:hypothetical protein